MYGCARAEDFSALFPLLLALHDFYMPGRGLVNAIAFGRWRTLRIIFPKSASGEPSVGLWRASLSRCLLLGISAAGLAAGHRATLYEVRPGTPIALDLYSFTLPATPPRRQPGRAGHAAGALASMHSRCSKERKFMVFHRLDLDFAFRWRSIPLRQHLTHRKFTSPCNRQKQTLGRCPTVLFMLLDPFFLAAI